MRKTSILIAAVFLLAVTGVAFGGTLALKGKSQEMSNWCWAATSQSVIGYKTGSYPSQCKINNTAWNVNYCCSSPSSCNYGNSMEAIANVCSAYGASSSTYGVLTMGNIRWLIDRKRPFIMGWYWKSGGGHALTGYGYSGDNVTYWDPWKGNGSTTANYNNVRESSQHTWAQTSYTH